MKILIVGGTWTVEPEQVFEDERRSSVVDMVGCAMKLYCDEHYGKNYKILVCNGGCYYNLDGVLNKAPEYDVVFWWANVPDNNLPKIRDVKEVAPHTMLVSSKRNDGDKYSFMELTQIALASKSNLVFEFKKMDYEYRPGYIDKMFHINVFDPLGCKWYDGWDVTSSIYAAMERLDYLRSITRQKTVKSTTDKNLVLAWYFDRFKQDQYQSEKVVKIPDEQEFVDVVKKHANTFYQIMNPGKHVERFLGNASMRPKMPPQVGRCSRGMPSFKKDGYVFVSQRNIDKQFIDIEHFVPCYMEDGKLYYCGDNKPSVDAPIQIRLYDALPNIRYMIHSHCYIDGAIYTSKSIPCGAIEEVDEVLGLIDNTYGLRNLDYYAINLKGHGSILMASNASMLHDVQYVGRQLPEMMFEGEN
jgi:hypothetical protein